MTVVDNHYAILCIYKQMVHRYTGDKVNVLFIGRWVQVIVVLGKQCSRSVLNITMHRTLVSLLSHQYGVAVVSEYQSRWTLNGILVIDSAILSNRNSSCIARETITGAAIASTAVAAAAGTATVSPFGAVGAFGAGVIGATVELLGKLLWPCPHLLWEQL